MLESSKTKAVNPEKKDMKDPKDGAMGGMWVNGRGQGGGDCGAGRGLEVVWQ